MKKKQMKMDIPLFNVELGAEKLFYKRVTQQLGRIA